MENETENLGNESEKREIGELRKENTSSCLRFFRSPILRFVPKTFVSFPP